MKKKLLITTALVAAFTATNAFAEIVIDKNTAGVYKDKDGYNRYNTNAENFSDNHIVVNGVEVYISDAEKFEVSAGKKIEINDGRIYTNPNNKPVKISGGEVIIHTSADNKHEAGMHGNGVEMTEGSIILNDGSILDDSARGFNMTGGSITMNNPENVNAVGSTAGGAFNLSKGTICKQQIDEYVKGLKLSLNQKTQIGLLSDGIDFLGFNHKLSATGKIIKSLRGSAKSRQRKYLKAIRHYYLNDVLDDEYIDVRLASYRGHLKGTKNWIHICNRLTSLKRAKRHSQKLVEKK